VALEGNVHIVCCSGLWLFHDAEQTVDDL